MRVCTKAAARSVATAVILGALGCTPKATPAPATVAPEPEADARDAREAPGEVLQAVVPLLDGGTLDLETLRGTPLVLALASTAADTFTPIRAALEELIAQHPEGLAVIVVATDPRAELVPRAWPGGPGSVHVGWDPQGALATRLQVRTLPTLFVLDRDGRVLAVHGGTDPAALKAVTAAADAAARG